MPIPMRVTHFNRRIANPVIRRFAGWLPPLALLTHRGRRSGRLYRIPVLAFPREGGFLLALTYGNETDWVRNVLAVGGCGLEYRRKRIALAEPELFESDPRAVPLPGVVQTGLRLLRVTQFMRLRRARLDPLET